MEEGKQKVKEGAMNKKLIVMLVLIGLALILILQNTQSVSLDFFFWSLVMPWWSWW